MTVSLETAIRSCDIFLNQGLNKYSVQQIIILKNLEKANLIDISKKKKNILGLGQVNRL